MTKILVVDDEQHTRMLLKKILESKEHDCVTASSAAEATSLISQGCFALVLLDIKMPGGSGFDVLGFIHKSCPETAVVMVSGLDDPDVARKAIEYGAYSYILKPFQANEVLIHINNALYRRKLEQENKAYRDNLEQLISLRSSELKESQERLKHIFDSVASGILLIDAESKIVVEANPAAMKMIGTPKEKVIGRPCTDFFPCPDGMPCEEMKSAKPSLHLERELHQAAGTTLPVLKTVVPITLEGRTHFLETITDISESKALEKRAIQAEKMESIGQLAAGIAHEINTPTQYIGDNTRFVSESVEDLLQIIDAHGKLLKAVKQGEVSEELVHEVEHTIDDMDLEYLREEIPKSIEQTLDGIERISKIVLSMKQYAHPGKDEKAMIDINDAIEKTITLARNEWKYVARMETDFDSELTHVPCVPGEFNQVMLNMIINAAHAVADEVAKGDTKMGTICIATEKKGDSAEIRISDTGAGIPEDLREKIFEPFFTTKGIGKGTGQGLAIAHRVIEEKHGGTLSLGQEEGMSTTFVITLPL